MRPLVGLSCCIKSFGPHTLPNHAASDACVRAAAERADAVPVLIPSLGEAADIEMLLGRLDGILLTGSRSMVNPAHYGGDPHEDGTPEDGARDATTLPLIRAAIARGLPVLAICRGLQELNVALGGSLHQRLSALPGRMNHAAPAHEDPAVRYAKAHDVVLTEGGALHRLAGVARITVNSLHEQGINMLAPGLVVEALAPDGTIEAVSLAHARGFALGVQWHPESDYATDPVSAAIFEAFGRALRRRETPVMALAAD
jgi:putative glutamine amidotransferase